LSPRYTHLVGTRVRCDAGSLLALTLLWQHMSECMSQCTTPPLHSTVTTFADPHASHTCFTATPSANASTRDSATRSPRCRLWAMALAPVGSTPMICNRVSAWMCVNTPHTFYQLVCLSHKG
jgi:hypothetical protein